MSIVENTISLPNAASTFAYGRNGLHVLYVETISTYKVDKEV